MNRTRTPDEATSLVAEMNRRIRATAADFGITLTADNTPGFVAAYLDGLAKLNETGAEMVAIYLTETAAAFAEEMGL